MSFSIEVFPMQLPEFLVLRTVYEAAVNAKEKLLRENRLIGKEFPHILNGSRYIVKEILPLESKAFPHSGWLTLVCNNVSEQRR